MDSWVAKAVNPTEWERTLFSFCKIWIKRSGCGSHLFSLISDQRLIICQRIYQPAYETHDYLSLRNTTVESIWSGHLFEADTSSWNGIIHGQIGKFSIKRTSVYSGQLFCTGSVHFRQIQLYYANVLKKALDSVNRPNCALSYCCCFWVQC